MIQYVKNLCKEQVSPPTCKLFFPRDFGHFQFFGEAENSSTIKNGMLSENLLHKI